MPQRNPMINSGFYKAYLIAVLVFTASVAAAQNKTVVKASIDKNKVLMGEPVRLFLEAAIPLKEPLHFFTVDTIAHFEFIDKGTIDTQHNSSNTILKQAILLRSFDSGHYRIPSFIWKGKIATDSIPVDVVYSDFDPGADYHGIRDIIEISPPVKKKMPWYITGAGLLILLVLLVWLLQRKKPQFPVKDNSISPYNEAMQELALLNPDQLKTLELYTSLIRIFRLYIFRKKGILSLQKTTDDLILQLSGTGMDKELYTQLSQTMRISDLVKFAMFNPSAADNKTAFISIRESIRAIEQIK